MAVTVKKAVLWRRQLANRPGTLAETLKPLAEAGVGLQVVMGYAYPGHEDHAAVEVWPISGAKAEKAARDAGLSPAPNISCLVVQGDDRAGLGHKIADGLAAASINVSFVMVQVTGKKYLAIFGFGSEKDADNATPIIKRAGITVAGKGSKKRKSSSKGSKRKKSTAKKGGKKTAAKKSSAKKSSRKGGRKKSSGKKPARKSTKSRGKKK
jgi:hypothetical protein